MKKLMWTVAAAFCAAGLWAAEAPSLVVTTAADVVNPNDGLISLREAVKYAVADAGAGTHPLLGLDGAYRITFADELFADGKAELVLESGITVAAGKFAANQLVIEAPGDDARRVYLSGGSHATGSGFGSPVVAGARGFTVGSGNRVVFANLNFSAFYTTGSGAAVELASSGDFTGLLEFNNCAFWGNKASGNGGAVGARGGRMTLRDCSFDGNKSLGQGGALSLDGTRAQAINVVVGGSNGYYVGGTYEGSYASGAALHLANAAELRLGNASFLRNYSGDVRLDASASRFHAVNSFFCSGVNATARQNLMLDSSASGAVVQLANCLAGTVDADFAAVSAAASVAFVADVNNYYVYANADTRVARGVDHSGYEPQAYCLGTGVAVMSDVANPLAGFGFRRVLDDAVDKEDLVAGTFSGPTGYDIFRTQFLATGSDKNGLRNCTIGAVHADAPVRYELGTGYDPNFDTAPSAGAAFVLKLSAGSVLPAFFDMPPVCAGRTVEGLCEYLFEDHVELERFETGDSVKYVDGVFGGCTGLTSVTLGRAVSLCDGYTFSGAPNLTEIGVDVNNTSYKSENGILYSASGSELVRVPEGAEVPDGFLDGVQYITYTSMDGCVRMGESLVIPDSVISIDDGALCNIPGLKTLEIGTGLVSFGTLGFAPTLANLPALTSVVFRNPGVKVHANEFTDLPALTTVEVVPADPAVEGFAGWRKVVDPVQTWPGPGLSAFGSSNDYMLEPYFLMVETLTFDAAGGAPVPAPVVDVAGRAIAIPVEPAKAGFYFAGWFEDAGLTIPASWTMQPGGGTYHAKWSEVPLTFTLTFDTNGGSAVTPVSAVAGTALVEPPAPTKSGFTFAGWYSDAGCSLPFVFSTMPAMDLTVYAKWVDVHVPLSTLTFDSCGGTTVHPVTAPVGTSLAVPADPVREGYVFDGWYADAACTTAFSFTYMPADSVTVYARWRGETYILSFDANGGTCSVFTQPVVYQGTVGGLPVAERPRYRFDGWFAGNDLVTESTVWSVPGDATLVARWTKAAPDLYSAPADTPFMGNASYSGWIRDENGAVKGFVTVKAGKAAKPERGGAAKLTVTYTPVGGRKITVKPAPVVATNQVAEIEIPGVGTFNLGGLSAASGTAEIQLGRDLLKDKDRAVKAAAAARVAGMDGVWTFALGTGLGDAGLSLTVRKGKAKLAGVLPNGDKVSLSAQGVLGESALAIPFVYSKKSAFALVFWIGDDRSVTVSDMTSVTMGGTSYEPTLEPPALLSAAGLADGTHTFRAGAYAQDFAASARKWDAGKKDVNPAGLKLKLAPKTGLVTGSFKGDAGKMTVAGALVDGVFHGAAFSRATPGVPATIE